MFLSLLYVLPRLSAVLSLRVAACRLAVLSRLCFELIKTARFQIASHLAPPPRFPSRHASCPSSATYPHQAVLFPLIAIRPGSPTLLAHRAASSNAPPNRHARRGEERGEDGCLAGPCYIISCGVICSAFSLYVSYSCCISRILVICQAFLLYIGYSCYMSRILVISTCFVLYYFVEIMRLWAGAFN